MAEGVVDSSLVATAMVLSLLSRLNCHNESHNPGFCALLGFALDGRSFAFGAVVALALTTAAVMHHDVRLRKAPLGAVYVRLAGLRLMRATFALLVVAGGGESAMNRGISGAARRRGGGGDDPGLKRGAARRR